MRKKGSITVFLAMLLTCFFSAVFAFLEAARVSGLKANVRISTAQAADTVLASYDRGLWENYHLLFWKTAGDLPGLDSLKSLQQTAIDGNRRDSFFPGKNYYVLRIQLTEVTTEAYELATDNGGAPFREQAAEMMKKTVGTDALQAVKSWLDGADAAENEELDLETKALDALENLEEEE